MSERTPANAQSTVITHPQWVINDHVLGLLEICFVSLNGAFFKHSLSPLGSVELEMRQREALPREKGFSRSYNRECVQCLKPPCKPVASRKAGNGWSVFETETALLRVYRAYSEQSASPSDLVRALVPEPTPSAPCVTEGAVLKRIDLRGSAAHTF